MSAKKTVPMKRSSNCSSENHGSVQASTASKKLLRNGVDGIKLFVKTDSPEYSKDALQGAIHEAHGMKKPVFAHPYGGADILTAIESEVDILAHTTPQSGPWDEKIFTAMKNRKVALIPTLTLWKYFSRHDRLSTSEKIVNTAIDQLRGWMDEGGTVLFGTDAGATEYDPGNEYTLMAKAGMNFRRILESLTTAPAKQFGQSGRIAAGSPADLVVLKSDPSSNLQALTSVQYTFRNGVIIYRNTGQ
jgi:imidazolonepropionase-like amidohydrolase